MALPLQTLAGCLGKPISAVLAEAPFRDWVATKSFDAELGIFDVLFAENGADLACDAEERVQTLFLFNEAGRHFTEGVLDLPFSCARAEVVRRLGPPDKSGKALDDGALGRIGAWDRFARHGYAIHVQYQTTADQVGQITLMRADIAP